MRLARRAGHELADPVGRMLPVGVQHKDMREAVALRGAEPLEDGAPFPSIFRELDQAGIRIAGCECAHGGGRTVGAAVHDDPDWRPDIACLSYGPEEQIGSGIVGRDQDEMCAGSLHSAPRRIQGDVGELRFDPDSPRLKEAVETFLVSRRRRPTAHRQRRRRAAGLPAAIAAAARRSRSGSVEDAPEDWRADRSGPDLGGSSGTNGDTSPGLGHRKDELHVSVIERVPATVVGAISMIAPGRTGN